MVAAAVAAWVIMAIGLFLLLETFTLLFDGSSAAAEWHLLPGLLRGTALVVVAHGSGWVVCLLVVGMPLAAAVAHRRWRRRMMRAARPDRGDAGWPRPCCASPGA